jgi:hypothetical protein
VTLECDCDENFAQKLLFEKPQNLQNVTPSLQRNVSEQDKLELKEAL